MRRYRPKSVSEAQLEDFVRQAPELLEPGMRFVEHQRRTGEGRLDVLLVDRANAFVVAELKIVEDDSMLTQALDYYDYVFTNREALARIHSAFHVDPLERPRILLIAPSFSAVLLQRVRWIVPRTALFTVRCVEFENEPGEVVPIYAEVTLPTSSEIPTSVTIDDHLGYIYDPVLQTKGRAFLEGVAAIGPEIALDAVQAGVSIKYSGRVKAYLWPYRTKIELGIAGTTWSYLKIERTSNIDDLVRLVRLACKPE